jgi:hypothetical protein
MWATYEKNVYTPEEIAKAMIHVDNSKCGLAVTQVKFFIQQLLTIRGGRTAFDHSYTYNRNIAYREQRGPEAG